MASLREILEQQKAAANAKGKPNGATTQPVLPVASTNGVSKETEGKKETLLEKIAREKREREARAAAAPVEIEKQSVHEGNISNTANTVVEQGPPEGLTGIKLALWRKEHEQKISSNGGVRPNGNASQHVAGSNSTSAQTLKVGGSILPQKEQEQKTSAPAENGAEKSASQTADAQKTNDGAIDPSELKRNLEYLANNITQKELVGQIIRTIAIQLRQNPQLTPFMTDADVDLVVRGIRAAYEIAARKRAEKSETKRKSTKLDIDIGEMLKSGGLDLKL